MLFYIRGSSCFRTSTGSRRLLFVGHGLIGMISQESCEWLRMVAIIKIWHRYHITNQDEWRGKRTSNGHNTALWSPHTCTTVSPSLRFSRGNNCSKKKKQTSEPSGHLSPSSPTYSPQNNRRLIDPSFTIRISTSTCPVLDSRALSNGWGLVVPDQYRGGSWSVQAQHSQGMIVCDTKLLNFIIRPIIIFDWWSNQI